MDKIHEIVFAGFGGQGVLSMGKILAYAGLREGYEVCWLPSYGPEMRGGTANCSVIISSKKISSPISTSYDAGVILNQPSLDKFENEIKPGGLLIYEEADILTKPKRKDIKVFGLTAFAEAQKLQVKQVANMIVLGALIKHSNIVKIESVLRALKDVLPTRHHHLIPVNKKALLLGMELSDKEVIY